MAHQFYSSYFASVIMTTNSFMKTKSVILRLNSELIARRLFLQNREYSRPIMYSKAGHHGVDHVVLCSSCLVHAVLSILENKLNTVAVYKEIIGLLGMHSARISVDVESMETTRFDGKKHGQRAIYTKLQAAGPTCRHRKSRQPWVPLRTMESGGKVKQMTLNPLFKSHKSLRFIGCNFGVTDSVAHCDGCLSSGRSSDAWLSLHIAGVWSREVAQNSTGGRGGRARTAMRRSYDQLMQRDFITKGYLTWL